MEYRRSLPPYCDEFVAEMGRILSEQEFRRALHTNDFGTMQVIIRRHLLQKTPKTLLRLLGQALDLTRLRPQDAASTGAFQASTWNQALRLHSLRSHAR